MLVLYNTDKKEHRVEPGIKLEECSSEFDLSKVTSQKYES